MKWGFTLFTLATLNALALAQIRQPYVIHHPSNAPMKEISRLAEVSQKLLPQLSESQPVVESELGDVMILVKNQGWMLISRDSELLEPIHFLREIFEISKKHGENDLIPFSELSESSRKRLRRDACFQNPTYDIGPKSCFALKCMFGVDVHSNSLNFSGSKSPSRFGNDLQKLKEFNDALAENGLVKVRTEAEIDSFRNSLEFSIEQLRFGGGYNIKVKTQLERKGLEIFEGWADFTLHQIDDQIYSKYGNDPGWNSLLATRTAHSADDLKRMSPGQYSSLLNDLKLNYKNYQLKSPDEASEALDRSSFSYRFSFTIAVGIQGSNLRYYTTTHW